MKKTFEVLKFSFIALCVVAVMTIAGYTQYTLWKECRSIHSWMYCMHTLNRD